MKQRYNRLSVVKDLIKKNRIDNQDTLLNLLKQEGYEVTQATLSRDLKMLKVGKISDGWSGYYYSLPDNDLVAESEKSYIQDVRRGVVSMEFSGNIGVIKTREGHANSVAVGLEALGLPEILGTLAGDDTIIVILFGHSFPEDHDDGVVTGKGAQNLGKPKGLESHAFRAAENGGLVFRAVGKINDVTLEDFVLT